MSTRRALLALAVPLIATAVVSAPAVAGQPQAPDRPLRVMSFNIHHGAGTDERLDLARIAEVIRQSDVDVVGLQEVDRHWSSRSEFVDQASWLARELNMHVVYGANLDLDPAAPGDPRRQYGTAILSNAPILNWDNTFLPRFGNHEQRGLLRARINVRGVPVQVYNTHLQHNDAAERVAQAQAIKQLIGTPDESVILVGDLNATPGTPEIQTLVDDLVDAWEAAGAGEGHTYPAEDPNFRIDYVLQSADVVTRTIAVVTSPLSATASDHLPVVADVALPGEKVGLGGRPVRPLPQAHAHNDYLHERPLLDALDHGFTSVEADIFLVGGELLVGHDPQDLRPGRTLQSLYLDPLAARVRANHGKVFRASGQRLQLLIDIKNTGAATYAVLDRVLRDYRFMLTTYVSGQVRRGAVTAVISGDRPRDLMAAQPVRYAFYDGRMGDLGSGAPASFAPLISDNWTNVFTWRGIGEMPSAERDRLRLIVETAHRDGQRVRFWATPDAAGPERDAIWRELVAADVDHINTDDLAGLENFLRR
ncbi:MAG TPA: endonuclease/exonuclease/phosphatase family protein [Candidatus Limnocylindrales bacterium]